MYYRILRSIASDIIYLEVHNVDREIYDGIKYLSRRKFRLVMSREFYAFDGGIRFLYYSLLLNFYDNGSVFRGSR